MNKKILRLILIALGIFTIFLVFLVVKNQLIDIIKYAKANDRESIKNLIIERGIFGVILIVVIQAIQMIVIFIPAEFIQLAAGISYPIPFAILFCLIGVFFGASIIYVLVIGLNFNRNIFYRSSKKLDDLVSLKKQNVTIQTLMYLLFVMPIIPFGAICYFGASTKMSYKKYIFTVLTGVLPSICFSITVAQVLLYSITENISIYVIIGLIIIGAIILFSIIALIIKKRFFITKNEFSPNGIYYNVLYFFIMIFKRSKFKLKIDRSGLENVTGPALILFNHGSVWDFIIAAKMMAPHRITVVTNRYYFRHKILFKILTKLKAIPKSLFYPDVQTIKQIILATKAKRYVVMFPEGRLSTDGTSFKIVEGIGALVKKLETQLIIIKIEGSYLVRPKWTSLNRFGVVSAKVSKKLLPEDIKKLNPLEIENLINDNLKHNEFDYCLENKYKYKGKRFSEGLEGVLYYCPSCNSEFSITTKSNLVKCFKCDFEVTLNNNYTFTTNKYNIKTISDWNQIIKNYELKNLENEFYYLETEVLVTKLHPLDKEKDQKGNGIVKLNKEEFSFEGNINNIYTTFKIPTKTLKALAFSVNEEFECYYENILYYFYPIENKSQCAKWALVQDLIYQKAVLKNE